MGVSNKDSGKIAMSNIHVEQAALARVETGTEKKVYDGDDALRILHTHFEPYNEEEENAVKKKIDRRLVPIMLIANGLQFLDKNTISSAATYGLVGQANLKGQEFSLLISIFYIGYLVAQYPTNILMQKYPTGKFITINFILWGATLTATAGATNFATLAVGRFFLGVFESCLNPGFILITSSFWKREEQTARIGLWIKADTELYSANGIMGAPSGLVFWGIAHIAGTPLYAYQWMFLIFGLITMFVGVSFWWLLPDSPMDAKFLNDRERIIAIERLRDNKTGIKNTHHKKEQVLEALRDPKVWMLALAIFFHNMTNSLQTSFTGLILVGLGYSSYDAVLLSIPPGIVMFCTMLTVSFILATKWGNNKRIFFIIFCYLPGIASCAILYASPIAQDTKSLHLFAVFILGMVATSAGTMYSLLASNVAGYTKKAVAGSIFFISSSLANIAGPQTFLSKEAPKYQTGVAVTLASFSANIVLFVWLYLVYYRENSLRDREAEGLGPVDADQELVEAFSDLTDLNNKSMRYKM